MIVGARPASPLKGATPPDLSSANTCRFFLSKCAWNPSGDYTSGGVCKESDSFDGGCNQQGKKARAGVFAKGGPNENPTVRTQPLTAAREDIVRQSLPIRQGSFGWHRGRLPCSARQRATAGWSEFGSISIFLTTDSGRYTFHFQCNHFMSSTPARGSRGKL